MEICAIDEKDLESISQLYVSVFSSQPWNENWEYDWAYERLNWIYQSQGFIGFIARDNNKTIGAILGHFVPFQGEKGFEIKEFLVKESYQNQGVGTKLLTRLNLELKHNHYNFISLLTAKDTVVESFYLKRNYQRNNQLVLLRHTI
ncbi:MAG: GNAT family N-acetyltransferase [Waterburya sp.]